MTLNKSLSLFLAASQIVFSASARATEAPSTITPEATLLGTVLATENAGLSQADLQNSLTTALTQYNANAPVTERADRMQAAMVALNISTSQQAEHFISAVKSSEDPAMAATTTTPTQAQELLSNEVTQLMNLNPSGAEFSKTCQTGRFMILGGFALFLGDVAVIGFTESNTSSNAQHHSYFSSPAGDIAIGSIVATLIGVGVMNHTSCPGL
jgi:hypothetical protein